LNSVSRADIILSFIGFVLSSSFLINHLNGYYSGLYEENLD